MVLDCLSIANAMKGTAMTLKEKIYLLKWVPVGCFMIGLGLCGLALKAWDKFDDARNLREPKTGKTKGL
jgi:hypothetical protein